MGEKQKLQSEKFELDENGAPIEAYLGGTPYFLVSKGWKYPLDVMIFIIFGLMAADAILILNLIYFNRVLLEVVGVALIGVFLIELILIDGKYERALLKAKWKHLSKFGIQRIGGIDCAINFLSDNVGKSVFLITPVMTREDKMSSKTELKDGIASGLKKGISFNEIMDAYETANAETIISALIELIEENSIRIEAL